MNANNREFGLIILVVALAILSTHLLFKYVEAKRNMARLADACGFEVFRTTNTIVAVEFER